MKKGSRSGGPVCSKCGYHACECPSDLQKDLQEMITDIEDGKYGKPEQWEELRDDLVDLL